VADSAEGNVAADPSVASIAGASSVASVTGRVSIAGVWTGRARLEFGRPFRAPFDFCRAAI
jgi:hypothetical protein